MTAKKISELAAGTALAGTELVPLVQGGVTVRTTAQDIADLAPAPTVDASAVTYTPVDATDWDTDTDPGNVDDALDQLAARLTDLGASAGASTTQADECIAGFIASPSDKNYKIVVKSPHGGTITEVTTISASGTCTATVKINSTALGGTANAVSSAEQSQAHASANVFAAGDDIVLTISANASCADLSFSIKYTRTLA
jgi:hypothetical protein